MAWRVGRGPLVAAGQGSLLADPRVTSGRASALASLGWVDLCTSRATTHSPAHRLLTPQPSLCDENYRTNQDLATSDRAGGVFQEQKPMEGASSNRPTDDLLAL